jgi:hypothetical protein
VVSVMASLVACFLPHSEGDRARWTLGLYLSSRCLFTSRNLGPEGAPNALVLMLWNLPIYSELKSRIEFRNYLTFRKIYDIVCI